MKEQELETCPYRWVVLFVFALAMAIQQLLWITFAPITHDAALYYQVSELEIGLLSLVFMAVYILVSIPSSWLIDNRGFRFAVGIGIVTTGVFGILRGIFAPNYILVLICQIGIAVGQPLILNAVTTISAKWFPFKERATAVGLAWLAGYLGLIIGLALTPYLELTLNIQRMLLYYGVSSVIVAIVFLLFAKEGPPTLQYEAGEEKALVFDGLKQMMKKRDFIILTIVFFIGLGVFNGLSTWIEEILRPRGFSSAQAGIIGGAMVAAGVIGSGIVPALADKFRNRVAFIFIAIAGAIPGLIGIAYSSNYAVLVISASILGFFMLSTAPLGFQYGAEVACPAPEGTSNGMLMFAGQVSGIIFIFGMDALKSPANGSMSLPMAILITLMVFTAIMCLMLRESELMKRD